MSYIYYSAFSNCTSLTTVVLPESIKSIGNEAFSQCHEISDVYCYIESPLDISNDVFAGAYPEYATLHVPSSSIEQYKSTYPWNTFGNIVALTDTEASISTTKVEQRNTHAFDIGGRKISKTIHSGLYIIKDKKVLVK